MRASMMMAPEDRALVLNPNEPVVSMVPKPGTCPLPLDERVADLAVTNDDDARSRLREIGGWLHREGGVVMMRRVEIDAGRMVGPHNRGAYYRGLRAAWTGISRSWM